MPTKINLGAGSQEAPGWIGYDRSRLPLLVRNPITGPFVKKRLGHWPKSTRVHDVTRGIPHADRSVDVIYSSHMLEHLAPYEADALLAECYRVLKPGGLVRLIVPDFKAFARAYLDGESFGNPADERADSAAWETYGAFRKPPDALPVRLVKWALRTDDGGHKWLYDEESLRARMEKAGFREIERVKKGESRDPEAGKLDIRSDYHVHMEAIRPR